MRIERLHFKNINSLKGEWTIDFTDPALSASGLFLITGDTGSGKSSILDAITIALYGKTPRIDRFSKTANEVMTRHTEECFAELLFSSGEHQYVARFEQRRARGKKDGNLQNPSYYFEDKENNQVYTKYNDVSRKVVDVTGMTYEQFTTSVLLAQGQFTEFLKSKVDDRARILEQITGTEIYSKISINVFEKYKKENLVLSELKTQVEGIEILSDEDRQAYVAKTENLRNTSSLLEKDIEKLRGDEEYLKRVQNCESRYQEALNLFSEAKIKLEHFNEENQDRLLADAKAQSLAGTHSSLKELRETSANTKNALEAEKRNLPLYEDKFTETSRLLSAAEEALNAHNKLVAEQQIIFDKVIEIDSRLSEQQKSRDSAKSEYESKKQQCEDQKAELSLKIAENKALEKESSEINKQLSDNTIFARLENDLSGIREKLNALSEAGLAYDKALTSLSQREQALEHSDKNIAALKKDLDEAQEELNKAEAKYQKVKTELEKLSKDSSVEKLRDLSFAFDNLLSQMEKTQGQFKSLSELEAELLENSQNSQTKNKELMPLTEALGAFRRELENTEHLIEITDQNFRFSEAFKNLEGIRSSLEEGKPCPCCGSTVHPFAANLPKLEDKLEKTLNDLKEQRKLLGTKIQKTESVINTRQGELNSLKAAYDSLLLKKTELLSQISSGFETIYSVLSSDNKEYFKSYLGSEFCELLSSDDPLNLELDLFSDCVSKVSARRTELKDKEQLLINQTEDFHKVKAAYVQLCHEKDLCAEKLESANAQRKVVADEVGKAKAELQLLSEKLSSHKREVLENLSYYEISEEQLCDPKSILSFLKEKLDLYRKLQQSQEKCIKALEDNQYSIEGLENSYQEKEQQCSSLLSAYKEKVTVYETTFAQREQLFGKKSVSDEKKKLSDENTDLENKKVKCADEKKQSELELHGGRERIKQLEDNQITELRKLRDAEENFIITIKRNGFETEKDYLAAILSTKDREHLNEEHKELSASVQKASGQLCAVKEESEKLKSRPMPELSAQSIQETLESKNNELKEVNQSLGSIQNTLLKDQEAHERYKEKAELIEKQRKIVDNWSLLNELIGSADGKKFRSKVQAITFGRLIECANLELRELSDRYRLYQKQDTLDDSLDFYVQDEFLGNDIRCCQNLSGGESFLISLALALGLSRLSCINKRIDSLFLDEGFGTLDSKSLEVAIDALENMRQRHGLVGIISHVETLKDRIASKLTIEKKNDGSSIIIGSGVMSA